MIKKIPPIPSSPDGEGGKNTHHSFSCILRMNLEYIFRILAEGFGENDENPLDKGNRESGRYLHHTSNPLREFRNIGDSYGPLVFLEILGVTPGICHMLQKDAFVPNCFANSSDIGPCTLEILTLLFPENYHFPRLGSPSTAFFTFPAVFLEFWSLFSSA